MKTILKRAVKRDWDETFQIRGSQSLPKDIQGALVRTGEDTAQYERRVSAELTEEAMKELEKKGMVLLGPPKDEQEWQKRAQAIWPKFYDKVGGREWVDQALKIIKAALKKG